MGAGRRGRLPRRASRGASRLPPSEIGSVDAETPKMQVAKKDAQLKTKSADAAEEADYTSEKAAEDGWTETDDRGRPTLPCECPRAARHGGAELV